MLLGQQRGRAKDGDLPAAGHRGKRRPQRHLGLAEAHVAAHQAVHRKARAHVLQHGLDGGALIRRFLEVESLGEGLVVALRELERVAFARGPRRIQVQQFGRRVAHLAGRAAPCPVPFAAAQRMQRRSVRIGADVAPYQVQLRNRHVQLGLVRVLQVQELGGSFSKIQRLQSQVAPDSVLDVHDRITGTQLGQVAHDRIDVGGAVSLSAALAPRIGRIQLGLGHHGQSRRRRGESLVQRRRSQHQPRVGAGEVLEAFAIREGQPRLGQHLRHRVAAPGRVGHQQHTAGKLFAPIAQLLDRIGALAVDRERGQGLEVRVIGFRQREAGKRLELQEQLLGRQVQLPGRQAGALRVARQEGVALAGLVPEAPHGSLNRTMQHDAGLARQIVDQAHVPIERCAARIALERVAPAPAKGGACLLLERKLAPRQKANLGHRVDASLAVRVERADRLDHVVQQIQPQRQRRTGREEVDQPAAQRELAGPDHLRHGVVAGQRQLRAQLLDVDPLSLAQPERARRDKRRWREALRGRAGGHQQHVGAGRVGGGLAGHQAIQRFDPLRGQVRVRRQDVVGKRFPVRKRAHRQHRLEVGQLLGQAMHVQRIGTDDHRQVAVLPFAIGQFRQQQRVGRAGRSTDHEALGRLQQRHGNFDRVGRKALAHSVREFIRRGRAFRRFAQAARRHAR